MRPLFLSFSGINSYASKAEIDFSHFLKDKIFGIFGETGAGKSTIIDAITYALFGRIDRAGNAINISINPKAKRLFVSFTFKTGSNVFKIVRTKTEKKTEATLYHVVDDKDMPIAEKDREVNEKISKIIGGFTYDEFTKIIALPQNKFSEFLTAKPADRASLLEKIFGLEIFGERLWEKLTERSKINSLELNNINTNLEQLRDVSEEQLFKKASRIKEIEAKIDEATKTLKEKEDRLSELKDLYRLQKNKEIVERDIKILLRHERDMENTRERLKNAEKVAPFRRDFANIDYWQKEIERSFHFIETAIKEVENINNSLSKLKEEEKTFEEEKTKREKEIAVTLKSVDEAIELKKKITDTEKDKTEKEMTLNNIKTQLAEKVKNVTALTENRKILEKRRDALKDEAKEIALSDHEYNLLNTLSTIEKHMGMLKEIEANITEERQNLSSLTSSMDLEKKNLFEIWKTFLPETPLNTPETADDELISIKNDIQTRIDKITSKIHKLELAESASFLAIELKEGEPCPVCGSKTHPAPAVKPPSDEILTWKKRLDEEKKILTSIEKLEEKIKKSVKNLRDAITIKDKTEKNIKSLEERKKNIKEMIIKNTGLDIDACEKTKKMLDERLKRHSMLSKDIEKTQNQLDETDRTIKILEDEKHKLEMDRAKLEEEIKQLSSVIAEYKNKIKTLIGEESPEKLRTAILKEEKTLKEKAESYKKAISEKENEIKELTRKIESEKGKKEELEKNMVETKHRIERELVILGISEEEFRSYILDDKTMRTLRDEIDKYEKSLKEFYGRLKEIEEQIEKLKIKFVDERTLQEAEADVKKTKETIDNFNKEIGALNSEIKNIKENLDRKEELLLRKAEREKEKKAIEDLLQILRGKEFVHFIVKELGKNIVKTASDSFFYLTNERMSLRLSDDKFNFYIYDHLTGIERPVDTLSGGEIFLASFSLALALSRHIQTMKARSIHFFFIDEGFGTLDDQTLSAVTGVMDRLRNEDVLVGFITHRKELKEIVSTQIIVNKSATEGSKLKVVMP